MKFRHTCASPLPSSPETVIFFVQRKKLEESSGQRNSVTFFWNKIQGAFNNIILKGINSMWQCGFAVSHFYSEVFLL